MPNYVYKAMTPTGALVSQEAVASSEAELRNELERKGLLVKAVRKKSEGLFQWFQPGVKPADFLQVNQELVTLLKAGLTVPEALALASDRPESPLLSSTLRRILQDVKEGSPLSDACGKYPRLFDGLYLSSLKTGERTGNLAPPMLKYQDYLLRREALRNKVTQALVYPLFLLLVLVLILILLFCFVMPRFAGIYADFHAEMPMPTRILMGFVHHLPVVGIVLGGGALACWTFWKALISTPKGRLKVDELKRRLPLVKGFTQPFLIGQTARTLSTLLSGGTPLTEAMKVGEAALSNKSFASQFHGVLRQVIEGTSFSKAVDREGLMPKSAVKLLEVGEASGQLGEMLEEIARSHEQLLENRIQRVMALVEPMFILLTGVLIGTIIIVMYLPIIHLSDIVK